MSEQRISDKLRRERELALAVLEKGRTSNTILAAGCDISDLFTDNTCAVELTPKKSSSSFVPDEISGRSTEFVNPSLTEEEKRYLTPGIEEIFRDSQFPEIREMENELRKSISSGRHSVDSGRRMTSFTEPNNFTFSSSEFKSSEQELSRMKRDEREWEDEYAEMPNSNSTKLDNLSVRCPVDSERSIGALFSERSDSLFKMIPNKSPPRRDATPLIDADDVVEKENINPMDTQTAENLGSLLNGNETPGTFLKKYQIAQKVVKPPNETQTLSPLRSYMRSSPRPLQQSPKSTVSNLDNSIDEIIYVPTSPQRSHSMPSVPIQLSRAMSQLSTSQFSLKGDSIFPVKASHLKLSWACTKLRTHNVHHLKLKNFINKRVGFRITISGPGFQLAHQDTEIFTLQALETLTLAVDFYPTVIGAAAGQIILEPPSNSNQKYKIQLYGYGGRSLPEIAGEVCVPHTGNPFIDMGTVMDLKQPIQKYISVRNRGNIDAFAIILPELKGVGKLLENASISIVPDRLVIPPKKAVTVSVRLGLRREDLIKLFKKQRGRIIKILSITCIMGDNVNRLRLKKCIKQVKENPDLYAKDFEYKQIVENQNIDLVLRDVEDTENEMSKFDDEPQMETIKYFIGTFQEQEIDLTLDRAADDTMQILETDAETTINFKSMILTEPCGPDHAVISVEPTELEVIPCRTYQFYIRNETDQSETFEISTDFPGGLECVPAEGEIDPDGMIAVNAKLKFAMPPSKNLKITIMYAKGKVELPVRILPDGLPPHMR